MTTYTEEYKIVQESSEECAKIIDGLDILTDEHLGSVLNATLIEMYQRDLSLDFVEGSLSNMAGWALGR